MDLVSFSPDLQRLLDGFLQVMQELRGYPVDRSAVPPAIVRVKAAWLACGGDFWVIEKKEAIIASR